MRYRKGGGGGGEGDGGMAISLFIATEGVKLIGMSRRGRQHLKKNAAKIWPSTPKIATHRTGALSGLDALGSEW